MNPAQNNDQAARADGGSAAAASRGASIVGGGNIAITGDVQGGVTIVQGGGQAPGVPPATPAPPATGESELAAVRDLLLAAFTAPELRRLFLYTSKAELQPLAQEISPNDNLPAMVERAIEFCQTRALIAELLAEVQRANPRQYARFAGQLRGAGPETG